jgi:hypothetical protein
MHPPRSPALLAPQRVVMTMMVHKRRSLWALPVLAVSFLFACSESERLAAPEATRVPGLNPAHGFPIDGRYSLFGDVMPGVPEDAPFVEIDVLQAPGPDGVMGTEDDLSTATWPDRFMRMANPPGDLWHALGLDLAPIDGGVAITVEDPCLGVQRESPSGNWSGGLRLTFLDPASGDPRTVPFVSAEVAPPVNLRAYDEAGQLLDEASRAAGAGVAFVTVIGDEIARVDITGEFWCVTHRIRYGGGGSTGGPTAGLPAEVSVTPGFLWPVNHRYRPIAIDLSAGENGLGNDVEVVAEVVSNEFDNDKGSGDGDTVGDIRVTREDGSVLLSSNANPAVAFDPRTDQLHLRAERGVPGGGRIYTITITITPPGGPAEIHTATVTVPVDQRPGSR